MARPEVPLSAKRGSPLAEFPLALHLRRGETGALHQQLTAQLRAGVLNGTLPAGLRLPGSRLLAHSLGVTRGVVAEAYAALVADGTLEAEVGSGTRVPAGAARRERASAGAPAWFTEPPAAPFEFADRTSGSGGIHFKTGVATTATLDAKVWRQAWAHAARQDVSGDYADPQGEPELRAALAAFVGRSRGLPVSPEGVMVTAGTLQALNLIVKAILPPGSSVLMENPGYRAGRQVLLDAGLSVHPLPLDEDGPVITPDTPPARLVYVTPSHQFPLGVRMSLPRRLKLLEWAEKNDALIIEDDYDGEFRYGAAPLPPLASLDTSGRVLYLGTLSKVLTPAVRTGFLTAPPALMPALVRARTLMDSGHPLPLQHALTYLMTHSEVDRHIRRSRRWHAQVREALTQELAPLEPLAKLGGIEAGLHVCLHLAPDFDATRIALTLARRNVHVSTVAEYSVPEYSAPNDSGTGATPNALLLGYGGLTVNEAVEGAREIRRVLNAML
ncbi:PLP-dependent aminotransferase family protein [Deinococcus fonticola]|uniref:MocR-like pyridoxine biosynthesis transcription factor PdxR n=1 Tax=Deinococcus fonticola TaxID=2528713 RepID=UPI0010756A35|nr:PLP-dependent aminotransferase family protein [Deinococcus fonticola]